MPLIRRYRYDRIYNPKRLQGSFATNILFADIKSLQANTCCQVYDHKVGFAVCSPNLNARGDSLGETIEHSVHDFGAPEHITFDGFQSQVGNINKFFRNLCKNNIDHHVSAPRHLNEKPA